MDDGRERDADLVLPLDSWRLREARAELTEGFPMPHQRVQFADTIEPLVQFIEETPRDEIIDRTLAKLREGVSTETMLMASALAVVRSSDLPPGHHGGPLHPLAGLYAITKLVGRLKGEDRFLPLLQHVALSNKHVHDPVTSPFSLLEFDPMDAGGARVSRTADLAADGAGDVADERDADDQRGEQVGVYLGARAEHRAEGRGYLALGRRVERHRGILAGRGAADQGDDERRLATARGLGLRHERRRDALRERVQVAGRDLGGDARPGQRLQEQLLLAAEVAHHQAVRDAGPPGDLPDGRARVAALVEDLARCLEDRRPRRFRVTPALGRRAV